MASYPLLWSSGVNPLEWYNHTSITYFTESLDESAAISPKALAKQLNLGNPIHLEKRIKRELEEQGMYILTPFPSADIFWHIAADKFENIVAKGENAHYILLPICFQLYLSSY